MKLWTSALLAAVAAAAPPPHLLEADRQLHELAVDIQPLAAVQPVGAEAQKADFLAGRIRNPELRYPGAPPGDPAATEAALRALEIPPEGMGELLEARRRSLLLMNRVVRYRGTRAVPWLTQRLNGRPSPRLLERARGLLAALPPEPARSPATVSPEELAAHLREELAAYGLEGWTVEVMTREGSTHVAASRRMVGVARRKVGPAVPPRLAVHEVGVHVLRAANGYRQPYRLFATGTAGYQDTEEGLAAYCEVVTGTVEPVVLRRYAARALGIDAMLRGLDFRDTFEFLRGLGVDEPTAWEVTLRAHRGGGYVKDHVYLDGLFRVLDFVDAGGELADLFVGKIRVADVPRVRAMVAAGELLPARWLPRRLGTPPPEARRLLELLRDL